MPEPIIEPMTSMVALVRPRPFTSSLSCCEWVAQSLAVAGLVSMLKMGYVGTTAPAVRRAKLGSSTTLS